MIQRYTRTPENELRNCGTAEESRRDVWSRFRPVLQWASGLLSWLVGRILKTATRMLVDRRAALQMGAAVKDSSHWGLQEILDISKAGQHLAE